MATKKKTSVIPKRRVKKVRDARIIVDNRIEKIETTRSEDIDAKFAIRNQYAILVGIRQLMDVFR